MTRSEAARKGGLARAKQFTGDSQRAARRAVSPESCRRNGAKGAAATRDKYGERFLFEKWRKWKIDHPSQGELLLIGIFGRLGIAVEREWEIGDSCLSIDFKIADLPAAVEFHGRIHEVFEQEKREARDARKRELLASLGVECLWLTPEDLKDVQALALRINEFVKVMGRSGGSL